MTPNNTTTDLPYAQTPAQKALWQKLQPINRVATTDTYKRTMACASDIFADNHAVYTLTPRRPLNEFHAKERLVVAGHEKALYPWFTTPVTKTEIDEAEQFFTTKADVKKFPRTLWDKVLTNDGYFPIDIWGMPGGQTILTKNGRYTPMLSVAGPGGLASHIEPQMTTYKNAMIQATKARMFAEVVGDKFAEFGLRSDDNLNAHIGLLLALKVGGDFKYTSDDQAVFTFPDVFRDIGTVGHEFLQAYQRKGKTLAQAQEDAYTAFVATNDKAALLPDIVDTIKSGLPAILEQIKRNPTKKIMPRFDSGNVADQAVAWAEFARLNGVKNTPCVVEDGYTPQKAHNTFYRYKLAGFDPKEIFVGAGGYFYDGVTRDAISLAYKRAATMHDGVLEPNIKFSDDAGKNSIPGDVRVYAKERTLIVAQADEKIDGTPLMQKLVENGRIVYNETLDTQAARAKATWNAYDDVQYSPRTQELITQRFAEKQALLKDLEARIVA